MCANEWEDCTCDGSIVYGHGSNWVSQSVFGTFPCTNSYMGKDPKQGTVKKCFCTAEIFDWSGEVFEAKIDNWYEDVAMKFFHENKLAIEESANRKVEKERGVLLETCEMGSLCREENKRIYRESITSEWRNLIHSFQSDIHSQVLKTQKQIEEGYETNVVCADENPCCTTPEVTVTNYYISISNWKKEVTTLTQ